MANQRKYEIRIKGHLNPDWADWLDGMEMRPLENGETVLSGDLPDQAALMGVLEILNRLNLAILSVQRAGERTTNGP